MLNRIFELKTGVKRLLLVVSVIYTFIVFKIGDGRVRLDKIETYIVMGIFWIIVRIVLWVSDGFNKD